MSKTVDISVDMCYNRCAPVQHNQEHLVVTLKLNATINMKDASWQGA